MTWLVVGASGQFGRSVCDVLSARGIEFVGAHSTEMDLRKPLIVKQLVEKIGPSVIINCAAYTNVDGAEDNRDLAMAINADGAGLLAVAARECGAVFAHVSTDYVFAGDASVPYEVDVITGPIGIYGESKAAGERNVLDAYESGSYIFRTSWLYSAYGDNFVKKIVRKALVGAEASVVDDQDGQPTYAGDVALQIVKSIEKKIPVGIYHSTNSGQASWFEFAQEIYRLAGAGTELVRPVKTGFYETKAKRPAYSVLSHANWNGVGVEPLRNWKIALGEAMPAIISAVKAEG